MSRKRASDIWFVRSKGGAGFYPVTIGMAVAAVWFIMTARAHTE